MRNRNQIRRRDLIAFIGTPFAYAAGAVALVLRFLSPLPRARAQESLDVGRIDDIRGSPPRRLLFNGRSIYVLADGEEIRAFDAECTHSGGNVNWVSGSQCFKCPLHGAVFSRRGVPIAGPTRRPLREYRVVAPADGPVLVLNELK